MAIPSPEKFLVRYAKERTVLYAFIDSLTEEQLFGPVEAAGRTVNDHHAPIWPRCAIAGQGPLAGNGPSIYATHILDHIQQIDDNLAAFKRSRARSA